MPRYAKPLHSEHAEDPIKALGNMVRAGLIGYLRAHGPSTRTQIAQGIGVPVTTVAKALDALRKADMLIADPPPDQARQGQHIRYHVHDKAVSEMYIQLGVAIGEL